MIDSGRIEERSPRGAAIASERLSKALEWPMAICALAVIPALLLDDGASTPQIHLIATAINGIFLYLLLCGVHRTIPCLLPSDSD